jgi:hypothetical protein
MLPVSRQETGLLGRTVLFLVYLIAFMVIPSVRHDPRDLATGGCATHGYWPVPFRYLGNVNGPN